MRTSLSDARPWSSALTENGLESMRQEQKATASAVTTRANKLGLSLRISPYISPANFARQSIGVVAHLAGITIKQTRGRLWKLQTFQMLLPGHAL